MLTGDGSRTAEAVARQVGITEFKARLLPEQKYDVGLPPHIGGIAYADKYASS
jgi:magnesium-transporting ATPase (P-type)